jgi:hypothetical protein
VRSTGTHILGASLWLRFWLEDDSNTGSNTCTVCQYDRIDNKEWQTFKASSNRKEPGRKSA